MTRKIAGMDIHKNALMAVVATALEKEIDGGVEQHIEYEGRRFGSGAREREHLVAWLRERQAKEVVMESTAPCWKPVWMDLELHFTKLHLAQAHSYKAPQGRKHDFADATRLTRRMAAGELTLSFVPGAEQRTWRTMTRGKQQLVSAEQNQSSQSPKGNKFLRRIFTQATQAAVKTKGCHFQNVFRRLVPKLGYKGAIWAIAHRLCRLAWKILHEGVSYIEQAEEPTPQAKNRRAQRLTQALRRLGYQVAITPVTRQLRSPRGDFPRSGRYSAASLIN
jgi:hypothetical protein